ncbi:acylphosphatase [Bacillus carboniphilus]|uniref:acylphosphatase n=1 Tax=Bacillus carboniphilus TaxID=86663 RepID=A0ABY9JSP2_9BACI|nr:acylphosphatase [Bacillus carboniphilus]WLR42414.1 acylphosphatase [Bacillus carboniphilus]
MKYHIFIRGKVQKVGFRKFTASAAKKLHIVGWVKNNDDGKVEVVAEGEKENLNKFVKKLKRGPLVSKVDEVKITEYPTTKTTFKSFEII